MAGAAGLAVALAYGAWAVSLQPFSGVATVAVVAGGCIAMVAGAITGRSPAHPAAALGMRDVAPWAAMVGAVAGWQLAAYLQEPRDDHPTLSSLANAVLDPSPARALACALWLVGAWALARQ